MQAINLSRPATGHVTILGPLPADSPDVLDGVNGVRAYRAIRTGGAADIFAVESFGHLLPGTDMVLVPSSEHQLPDYSYHPAVVLNDEGLPGLDEVLGTLTLGGAAAAPTFVHENAAEGNRILQTFRVDFEGAEVDGRFWFDFYARTPVARVEGFFRKRDRRPGTASIRWDFGERIQMEPGYRNTGLTVTDRAMEGTLDFDVADLIPFRFLLLCETGTPSELEDLTREAIDAVADGTHWFMPRAWDGADGWLNGRPRFDTPTGVAFAQTAQMRMEACDNGEDDFRVVRPWSSAPQPNQGGAQSSLGSTFWAPLFVDQEYQPQHCGLFAMADWAFRPAHLFRPGTLDPIDVDDLPGFNGATISRQCEHDVLEPSLAPQRIPTKTTPGVIPAHWPFGAARNDVRRTHDEQHAAEGPLAAIYMATGSRVARHLLMSHRGIDLAQKRPRAGWTNLARGEGRTATSMLMSAAATGDDTAHVTAHVATRLTNALSDCYEGQGWDGTELIRPARGITSGALSCNPQPAFIPYEEATVAAAFWALYLATGADMYGHEAARFGLVVASSLHFDGARWTAPYAMSIHPDGEAWPMQERDPAAPGIVHPGDWLHWCGAGLAALLEADMEALEPNLPGVEVLVGQARAAWAQINAEVPPTLDRLHSANWHGA